VSARPSRDASGARRPTGTNRPHINMSTVRQVYDEEKRPFDSRYIFWRTLMMRVPAYMTLPLARHGVSPNTITVVSIIVGLVGSLELAFANRVIGILLLLVWQVLDCVDGLLASVSGRTSRLGAFLDTCGAHLMYGTVFLAWGVGLAIRPDLVMQNASTDWLGLEPSVAVVVSGGLASLGTTLRALFSYEYWRVYPSEQGGGSSELERRPRRLGEWYRWLHRNFMEFLGFFLPIMLVATLFDVGSLALVAYSLFWLCDAALGMFLSARRLAKAG
jgi:hypothetical protein